MLSNDHLLSFTLSAAVHLAGLLLLGEAVRRAPDEAADTMPELMVSTVHLTLSETEPAAPGAAAAPAPPETPPLSIPEPEAEPLPKMPQKQDFSETLPELPTWPPEPPPTPASELPPAPQPPTPPEPVAPPPRPVPQPAAEEKPVAPAPPQPLPSVESAEAAGDGGAAGRIDAQPSLDRAIRPVYPLGARRRGEEGTVVLDVRVAVDGRAAGVSLIQSSGFPELDRAAERATAQARFNPATRGGLPVESAARLTLVFRLRDL